MTISFLPEFRQSAISDRLTLANITWLDGDDAISLLTEQAINQVQRVGEYVTTPAKRILERYEFARYGGWFALGTTIDGGSATVPYFKPANPRKILDSGKVKRIKYETPQGCEALPLLPFVDNQTAAVIYDRYQVTPLESETFWQVVRRCKLPIVVTEGLKKALALIAHGIPAIAIRGITQWHKKGGLELHDCLAAFADSRQFYIVFDQDEKPVTQRNVRIQALKLGAELEKLGCKVGIPTWDLTLGKGVDDVLFSQGDNAQDWLDGLVAGSPTLIQYKRYGGVATALATIAKLNSLSFPTERETEGEYLPELPPLQQGAVHVVDASMNAGKTTRIGADWLTSAKALGWLTVVLTPINNLGKQSATDWDLPHIHDYPRSVEGERQLWEDVRRRGGVVLCPDSLLRLPQWVFSIPLLLILDEGNQVVDHITQGDTLGSKYSPVIERFAEIAKHAANRGAIVLSEANLPDRTVKSVQTLSQCDRVRVFKHRKVGEPWDCCVFTGQASGYRALLLQAIAKGVPILIVTSSQQEGRRLSKVIGNQFPDTKVTRIDSETNQQGAFKEFFASPDEWLKANKPDVLILSPSAKSGVSIEGRMRMINDAYFESVWGYFPALATDTHMQLLGRYRPSVPRFIFVPPFIQTSGDESLYSAGAIKRRLGLNQEFLTGAYDVDTLLDADGARGEEILRIENAVLDYLAEARAVSGAQKSIAHAALVDALEQAGHRCICEKLGLDRDISKLWKETQEEIWREDATEFAGAKVEAHHTPAWARSILDSFDSLMFDRIIAQKVLYRGQFPGILFDCPDECYQALFNEYGKMRQGVVTQAKAENIQASKEDDRGQVEAIFRANIRGAHRLPKSYARSLLLHKIGILDVLTGQYSNTSKLAIAIKQNALHFAKEISYWLRLTVTDQQTPVTIINKLLKKFGLEGKAISRPGKRRQQQRIYQVEGQDNPLRIQLLEAFRRRLSGGVSTICNRESKPYIQIVDTSPPSPTTQGHGDENSGDNPVLLPQYPGMRRSDYLEIADWLKDGLGDCINFASDILQKAKELGGICQMAIT